MTTIETTDPDLTPGVLLLHYKGTRMRVLHQARDTNDGGVVVVYVHLEDGVLWVRPRSEFSDRVMWPDGVERTRFVNVAE